MAYERKLERANELHSIIKKAAAELETLFGNEDQPRRGRPRKSTGSNGDGLVDAARAPGADTADNQPM